ncbi:MAG TPA: ATP-dependent helicase C-terminal domain-containing protein, partial [Holophagaceae bacterium]|nr:ATP-dependent helicase C-terminal domain-containing protein [Holophagaceae bacterium]
REEDAFEFNESRRRVERVSGLWFGEACLDATRKVAEPGDAKAATLLAEWLRRKLPEPLLRLLDRAAFLAAARPDLRWPAKDELRDRLALRACLHTPSLAEAEASDWTWIFTEELGSDAAKQLDKLAPDAVQLPKRRVPIEYGGERPWIESRLQDFLGMKEGPSIAGQPLVLHLLAPNYRAVQVTTDLAGFWHKAYQELRPALSRRYPRHLWPEKPWELVKE